MPKYVEIIDPKGGRYKILSTFDDVIEQVPPTKWFGAYKFFQLMELGGYPEDEARELAYAEIQEWLQKPCPDCMMALFHTSRKRDQERLLKGNSVTPEDLICWFLRGGRYNGVFSQYSYDGGVPAEYRGKAPILIDATKVDYVEAIGHSTLSDAAMKHVVETQNKVIAQFLDLPDGRWYCFYRTHRGIAGRESGSRGQHMHFISSAYGNDRPSLVAGFKEGVCPSNGFHVHLSGYWDEK